MHFYNMKRNVFFIITLALCVKVCNAQIKHKMFVGSHNIGQYELYIIPLKYDTTVSDTKILQCIDSLPGHAFHSKMYNLLYAGDSTKLAIQVNEGAYLFHVRYEVVQYYKNGQVMRRTYYNKHLKKYWTFKWYADASPMETGKFNGDKKKSRWQYFNADGNLVKKEWYAKDGTIKKSNDYNPPKHTFITTMNPKHKGGQPYVIQ